MTFNPATKLSDHRNLFNGDSTFLFYDPMQPEDGAPLTPDHFHKFIRLLAESGVDTYLCCTNAQVPWFPSKVSRSVLTGYTRGNREFVRGHYPPPNDVDLPVEKLDGILDTTTRFLDRYLDLVEAGVDWVLEISRACRAHSVSPWVSVRMNDAHGANSWEKSYMNCDLQRDPKYRLRPRSRVRPDDGGRFYTLLNFEHAEVRDYYFSLIRELVEDYDFEGIELDWTRTPACCEPGASQDTCDLLTNWIASIRDLTRRRAEITGRPYPLGLRVPVRLDLLKTIGLDVRAMAHQDLIDFICPSNLWQTTWDVPNEELQRELGDGVRIYGVIEDAPNWMMARSPRFERTGTRLLSSSPELLRGNAAGKLASGAHGIEAFNFFCTDEAPGSPVQAHQKALYPMLRGLHDLESLRGQPKHYAFSSQLGGFSDPLWEYADQVPFMLLPGWRRALKLPMCGEPDKLELTVQIVVHNNEETPVLGVSFNGSWPNFECVETDQLLVPTGIYTHHVPEHVAFNYRLKGELIHDGWNELVVFNGQAPAGDNGDKSPVTIVSLELEVH